MLICDNRTQPAHRQLTLIQSFRHPALPLQDSDPAKRRLVEGQDPIIIGVVAVKGGAAQECHWATPPAVKGQSPLGDSVVVLSKVSNPRIGWGPRTPSANSIGTSSTSFKQQGREHHSLGNELDDNDHTYRGSTLVRQLDTGSMELAISEDSNSISHLLHHSLAATLAGDQLLTRTVLAP